MSAWRLECEDVSNWAKSYKGERFHALLCDPPYEYGFMGKSWDDSGVSYRAEVWAALAEHLHPGAFGMAFGGARSWHRLACAIEDAGLRIHPSIFGWAYGCLSDDTEILTSEGWKSYRDNLTGSMVMCYNLKDGTFDYMPVQEVFEYEISDTAFRIQSDSTDQIVTKDHRCLVERSGKFVFKRASALERKEKIPVLEGVPDVWSSVYGDELRRVPQKESLFAEMRHGNITTQTQKEPTWTAQRQIGIFSKAQAQREDYHLSSVWQEGVQAACFSQGCQGADMLQSVQWGTPRPRMGQTWRQRSRWLDRREHGILSKENVWPEQPSMERRRDLLPQEGQLRRFQNQICAMSKEILADGSQGRLCDGTSSDCGAAFRPLSQAVGGCASQGPQSRKQQSCQFDVVQEQQRPQEIRGDWQPQSSLATVTPFHYKGIVWCVRVPTGAFVARRNGHIFITGNSGFPKATRIDTQIDKAARAEREVIGQKDVGPDFRGDNFHRDNGRRMVANVTTPATPLAAVWEGHRYGLQALKPALEPIIVFQKPYDGKPVDCIVETGAGALNIDGSRISTSDCLNGGHYSLDNDNHRRRRWGGGELRRSPGEYKQPQGRWPSNFILQHSPECVRVGEKRVKRQSGDVRGTEPSEPNLTAYADGWQRASHTGYADADGLETIAEWRCVPECPVRRLGEMSGESKSTGGRIYQKGIYNRYNDIHQKGDPGFGDTGTAARFFYQSDWSYEIAEQLENVDAVYYCAKASKKEREDGLLGVIPCAEETCRGLTTTTHINKNGKEVPCRRCIHPTVKPISLTKYLATILLPPPAYAPRRILVPFAGIASEMIGAALVGWEEIVGIELEQIYCNIGEARLNHWTKTPTQLNLL